MYEQVSHALLNDILINIDIKNNDADLQHFYTRLGANFLLFIQFFIIYMVSEMMLNSSYSLLSKRWHNNTLGVHQH